MLYDINLRNSIYINLIKIFRGCFVDDNKVLLIDKIDFFDHFFTFLHNPHIIEICENPDGEEIRTTFLQSFVDQDIGAIILDRIHLFKSFIFRRKQMIEDIAKVIWMKNITLDDDLEIWVTAESKLESDLIYSLSSDIYQRNTIGINRSCICYDFSIKRFPSVLYMVEQ